MVKTRKKHQQEMDTNTLLDAMKKMIDNKFEENSNKLNENKEEMKNAMDENKEEMKNAMDENKEEMKNAIDNKLDENSRKLWDNVNNRIEEVTRSVDNKIDQIQISMETQTSVKECYSERSRLLDREIEPRHMIKLNRIVFEGDEKEVIEKEERIITKDSGENLGCKTDSKEKVFKDVSLKSLDMLNHEIEEKIQLKIVQNVKLTNNINDSSNQNDRRDDNNNNKSNQSKNVTLTNNKNDSGNHNDRSNQTDSKNQDDSLDLLDMFHVNIIEEGNLVKLTAFSVSKEEESKENYKDLDDNLKPKKVDRIIKVAEKYADSIAFKNETSGQTKLKLHKMPTGTTKPIKCRSRRIPFGKQNDVVKLIEMLEEDVEPSDSDWSSPIVLVKKINGKAMKLCYNPKRLTGRSGKLQGDWRGPYVVINKINDIVYRIQQAPKVKMKVVHVNRLAKYYVLDDI